MNDCDYKNVQEDSKYYNQDATSRALASSVNSSKFAPARCPPPPYSPVTSSPPKYSPKRIEETMNLPPPVYTSEILKVGSSTAARELEKGERVCVRSPQPNKKLAFYPYSSPRMHTLDHHNYFTHGEVGLVIDKYTGSNEVLYNVELSRDAKGRISRKCTHKYVHTKNALSAHNNKTSNETRGKKKKNGKNRVMEQKVHRKRSFHSNNCSNAPGFGVDLT